MHKLLVPLSGRADEDATGILDQPSLTAAFVLGGRLGAHIEVFCIEAEPETSTLHMADWVPGSAMNDLIDIIAAENEKRRLLARALFEEMAAHFGCATRSMPVLDGRCSVEFIEKTGTLGGSIAKRGRVADLIVTAKPDGLRATALPAFIEAALTQTGRPVLIGPQLGFPTIGERILIAWDGGEDAARTVALAGDLLRKALSVTIVSIREDGEMEPSADDLADYLRWAGVDAVTIAEDQAELSIASSLLNHADRAGADLIVLGASLRSKLSRLLFGSVSAEILERANCPIFMAD